MSKGTKKIIYTFFSKGRRHDFRIFKESKTKFHSEISLITDGGYRGLKKLYAKSQMPKRRSRKNPFLSKERVINENAISLLKRFKILADRDRNRQKRFGLRFNLIAGVYNLELR